MYGANLHDHTDSMFAKIFTRLIAFFLLLRMDSSVELSAH